MNIGNKPSKKRTPPGGVSRLSIDRRVMAAGRRRRLALNGAVQAATKPTTIHQSRRRIAVPFSRRFYRNSPTATPFRRPSTNRCDASTSRSSSAGVRSPRSTTTITCRTRCRRPRVPVSWRPPRLPARDCSAAAARARSAASSKACA